MELILSECLEALKKMEPNSVDSIVTDPPAGISFMGKDWDHDKGGRDSWIKWMEEIAKECLRVINPGGHGLVWALPRTSHWTATAWENAGFEVRDRVSHIFGSGFPKSHNISKAIDKILGEEREVVGMKSTLPGLHRSKSTAKHFTDDNWVGDDKKAMEITKASSDLAKQYEGFGTALKPAMEDWWLFRKPLEESTIAENVMKHGTGGLNIDGCRIESSENLNGGAYAKEGNRKPIAGDTRTEKALGMFQVGKTCDGEFVSPPGRWPANVTHDGSEEVVSMFPNANGPWGKNKGVSKTVNKIYSEYKAFSEVDNNRFHSESGSVARFFYCAKSNNKDRNEGCEDLEAKLYDEKHFSSAQLNDLRMTHEEIRKPRNNNHPCVKNTNLMRWLCRLVTPKHGIILDPFMGSGSTGKACVLEGFDFIGIEMDANYFEIAKKRIAFAQKEKNSNLPLEGANDD